MAERSRFRPKAARTRTSKTERLARGKAKDAPGPDKPSARIGRAKAASRVSARRGDGKGSPEAQAPDDMMLGAQGSGAEATAALHGQEAHDAGANQSTEMPDSAGSRDAAPNPELGQAEVASGDEPKETPAPQSQDAAPTKAEPDATETAAPPPPGAEGGTNQPIAGRSRRRRASALETSDADTQAAAKKRARAKRSDRGVGAGTVADVPTQTKAADADAVAPTKRRLRATEGLGNEAAAETGAAPTRHSREKPSVLDERRRSQAAASVGRAGSAGRPPGNMGIGSRTEPGRPAGEAIGDLAGQAAVAAARPAEVERVVAVAGLPVERSVEASIRTVTAELTEFAFRSIEEGMTSLRELSRIRTLPELAEFQARQAQAAVAAWQHHAAKMNEIYGALLKPQDPSRK